MILQEQGHNINWKLPYKAFSLVQKFQTMNVLPILTRKILLYSFKISLNTWALVCGLFCFLQYVMLIMTLFFHRCSIFYLYFYRVYLWKCHNVMYAPCKARNLTKQGPCQMHSFLTLLLTRWTDNHSFLSL